MVELPLASGTVVVPDILAEHLSELASLWEQREQRVYAPDYTPKGLAALEARAHAHLDGLRIGAGQSVGIARPTLSADETGLAIAGTFVMMAFETVALEREVVQALIAAPPKGRDGIRIGLHHCDIKQIAVELAEISISGDPAVRAAAVDILAFHRLPPPKGIPMLLGDPDPGVRRLAYDAAGRFGGPWSYDVLRDALDGDIPALRIAALRASARMGLVGLDDSCRQAGTRAQNPVPEALEFLGVLGHPRDLPILQNAMARPELAAAALSGMGRLGFVAAIPVLLDAIGNEKLTFVAGRAFTRMTGAVAASIGSSDAALPPDPAKARAWWEQAKSRFTTEGRWQAGFDVSNTPLGDELNALPLDTRLDVFLGARARDPQRIADRELERIEDR